MSQKNYQLCGKHKDVSDLQDLKKIYSPCILYQEATRACTPSTQGNNWRKRETVQKTGNSTRERGKSNFQWNGEEKNQNSGSLADPSNKQSKVEEEDKELQERKTKKPKKYMMCLLGREFGVKLDRHRKVYMWSMNKRTKSSFSIAGPQIIT